jgi:hypothetical protein
VNGLLFANRCTWAHAVAAAADVMQHPVTDWLTPDEFAAVRGEGDPTALWRTAETAS